jgi:hypothetical protein
VSRSTRPLRRVGAADREALGVRLGRGFHGSHLGACLRTWPRSTADRWLRFVAASLACRPAQLRRCLLGRPVSARAAGRILAS